MVSICIISFSPPSNMVRQYSYYSHFTSRKSEAQRGARYWTCILHKSTWPLSVRDGLDFRSSAIKSSDVSIMTSVLMIHWLSFSPTPVPLHFVQLGLCKLYFHAPWPTVFPLGFPYWWYLWAILKHHRDRRWFLLIQNEAADGSCWSSNRTGTILDSSSLGRPRAFLWVPTLVERTLLE